MKFLACALWLLVGWWFAGEFASQASPVRKVGAFFQGMVFLGKLFKTKPLISEGGTTEGPY